MRTDLELVDATLAGSKFAFEVLVLRYQIHVYRLVHRIIKNPCDASDIVQETLLKAYQNLDTLKDGNRFSIWLLQIAKNLCINWIHRHQRDLMVIEDELVRENVHLPSAPDEILIEREIHQQVMEAISKLPGRKREAARMFYLEGKSYSEIQNELGIAKGTLGRFLYDARARLRKALQASCWAVVPWMRHSLKNVARFGHGRVGASTCMLSRLHR